MPVVNYQNRLYNLVTTLVMNHLRYVDVGTSMSMSVRRHVKRPFPVYAVFGC